MSQRICAVVVTHNRLNLLQECIEGLRNQTRKLDKIIVVNNDSQDGTREWLNNQNDLTSIHQDNLGGAGGFHNGIKAAYEKGYDWIWCMDDDCYVDKEALAILVQDDLDNSTVYNSLILDFDRKNLSFYLIDSKKSEVFKNLFDLNGNEIINDGAFFNGTLISKEIVNKVGLPITDLFFRGDEVEYKLRVSKKFSVKTKIKSIIYHPSEQIIKFRCLGINHVYLKMPAIKKYFYHRNTVYIYKKYRNRKLFGMLKNFIFDVLCAIIELKDLNLGVHIVKGFFIGIFYNPILK